MGMMSVTMRDSGIVPIPFGYRHDMASNFDLEEQEQLAELKHFWKTYGHWITLAVTVVLGAYAAYTGYQYWQRDQASKAAQLYDQVEQAVQAGDVARIERAWTDIQERYGRTTIALQAGLLTAQALSAQSKDEAARKALAWVVEKSSDPAYRDMARLRLASLYLQSKNYSEAQALLSAEYLPEFQGLAHDLRGDVLQAQEQAEQAKSAYQQAQAQLKDQPEFLSLVNAKLAALGVATDSAKTP